MVSESFEETETETRGGGSARQWKATKTLGTSSLCFLNQIGAMIPSGNKGLPGCRGESGDLAGRDERAEVEEEEVGLSVEFGSEVGIGEATDLGLGRVFRGGSLTCCQKGKQSEAAGRQISNYR